MCIWCKELRKEFNYFASFLYFTQRQSFRSSDFGQSSNPLSSHFWISIHSAELDWTNRQHSQPMRTWPAEGLKHPATILCPVAPHGVLEPAMIPGYTTAQKTPNQGTRVELLQFNVTGNHKPQDEPQPITPLMSIRSLCTGPRWTWLLLWLYAADHRMSVFAPHMHHDP